MITMTFVVAFPPNPVLGIPGITGGITGGTVGGVVVRVTPTTAGKPVDTAVAVTFEVFMLN